MSKVIDRLERMTLNLASPDGNLYATVDSERRAQFKFRDESRFEHYDAPRLSTQIKALLDAMSTGRERGVQQAYAADGRELAAAKSVHWDAAHRRFQAALAKVELEGYSDNGLLLLQSGFALSDHRVTIDREDLPHTSCDQFLRELSSAYHDLLNNRRQQRAELLRKHLSR